MDSPAVSGSLRNQLALTLIGGAAVLALVLYFAARNYAVQVVQQGQDSILEASVAAILDAAAIRNGQVELDLPYSAFSMLSTPADDRVFYAILQDGDFLSGYEDLGLGTPLQTGAGTFWSGRVRGAPVPVEVIPRLYAAGCVSSTYSWSKDGGMHIADSLAFGRVAGRTAAAEPPTRG